MSHTFRRLVLLLWGIVIACVGWTVFPQPTLAQGNGDEIIPLSIPPLSGRTALLAIPLSVQPPLQLGTLPVNQNQELREIRVVFEDQTPGRVGLSIQEDFLPLTPSAITSGLALYQESGSRLGFNFAVNDPASDYPIDLDAAPTVEADPIIPGRYVVTFRLRPNSPRAKLPAVQDKFPDYYVVAQTSLQLMHGDTFEAYIPANGIRIVDRTRPMPQENFYENRFPGPEFENLNPEFAIPAVFMGDIVSIYTPISDVDNSNRISNNSEPTTVLGFDVAARADQEYFLSEIRVNWVGLNLQTVARLMANLTDPFYNAGFGGVNEQVNKMPSYFYSPWFYNFPTDAETGELLTNTIVLTIGDEEVEFQYPMTMPLDDNGFPREAFIIGADNPESHVTSYVPFGPRPAFSGGEQGLVPRLVTRDIFQAFRPDAPGGIFLYRDLGGVRGKFDAGVDRVIKLNPNQYRVEPLFVDPEQIAGRNAPLRSLLRSLMPGMTTSTRGKDVIPWLYQDNNLGLALLNVFMVPDPVEEPRPPLGSVECWLDPDCLFWDLLINVQRPYLGLTEGQVRYLLEHTENNGRTNAEDLFGMNLVQGFTFVLPIARDNAISDLSIPTSRTGANAGAEFFVAIQTSNELRNLDSFIPFIRPRDVVVGTRLQQFTQGNEENVERIPSVSSIGLGRPNTQSVVAMIGRPRPNFIFNDLTQPAEGENAGNNNILYDQTLGAPPKAVIGIDVQDYSQNHTLVNNFAGFSAFVFESFLTQSTVMGEVDLEFLPGPSSLAFSPAFLGVLPAQVTITEGGVFIPTSHSIAIYEDDDTPEGDGIDNDGDGLVDEELYNLMDDDGDGLIDEDIGDGTPAGFNGSFDPFDQFLPSYFDQVGTVNEVINAQYVFPPNSVEKYQDYLTAILPADAVQPVQGDYLPLGSTPAAGFLAELDMRALAYTTYTTSRANVFGLPGFFSMGDYNQGRLMFNDHRTGVMDLLATVLGFLGPEAPLYPEELSIVDPVTQETIYLINLVPEDGAIAVISDPDGDPRRTFANSLVNGLRIPNPMWGFVRLGRTPLIFNVNDDLVAPLYNEAPTGDAIRDADPYTQFGFYVSVATAQDIGDYISDELFEAIGDAFEQALETKADFEEAVAEAEAAAAEQEEPTEPDYPDLPEPIELSIPSPLGSLGISNFLETPTYQTNYMYQIPLPDENFGPMAGNDFFIVLRASNQARVGDSFKMRISSGRLNDVRPFVDPADGTQTLVQFPEGGIGYHSWVDANWAGGNEAFRNVSKASITTGEIVIRSQNVAPTIRFISPSSGVNITSENLTFDIVFQAEDPDDVARVELYIDDDNQGFDGTFIPGARLFDTDTTFTVNLAEAVPDFDPTARYYIYARVSDNVNNPVFTYAPGYITTPAGVGEGAGVGPGTGNIISVRGDQVANTLDYIKITDDGRNFRFGEIPAIPNVEAPTEIVDMELDPTFTSQLVVTRDGRVYSSGDPGAFRGQLQPNNELVFAASETFFYQNASTGGRLIRNATPETLAAFSNVRDMEVDFGRRAIYILDGFGNMLMFGNPLTTLVPPGLGMDLYRDMELAPTGDTMYFLTGNGILTTAGMGSSVGSWNNIVEGDVYRDMSLITRGPSVTNVVITDEDGNITVLGSGGSALEALRPTTDIPPGSIRAVKVFPGLPNTLLLMEGSGRVHYLTSDEITIPVDNIVFADTPGLEDDRVVDIETTSVNLQSVVDIVNAILTGISQENLDQIMAHVSPNYRDQSGATAAQLRESLLTMFRFYEFQSFSRSRINENNFIISNQGNTVVATVIIDQALFTPRVLLRQPDVDAGSTAAETLAITAVPIYFDQTISIRELADGRGWIAEVWDLRHGGRQTQDILSVGSELEFQDLQFITTRTNNRRIGIYAPQRGPDPPKFFTINVDEQNPLLIPVVMLVMRENFLNLGTIPPIFELVHYTGAAYYAQALDQVNFRFNRRADGSYELAGMRLRQFLLENTQDFGLADQGQPADPPLIGLGDQEFDDPYGFSFSDRGPVITYLKGQADLVMQNDLLQVTVESGGIMMLPETQSDIYAINPQTLLRTLSRTTVRLNPFDPATAAGGIDAPGYQASIVPGRSYLVILRDGRRYGFLYVPPEQQLVVDADPAVVMFDYRFDDSFVLPDGF